ncbi:hypothetical protein C1645_763949 [Glomus cerebriforme]|uniref:Uncharacterized protein n=1 Tax=Glomus cerebriforme TaxID=658196 RepID=A0A397T3V6_9GLOM|nr:hypothetical protein C1645_763949 [Glomus cerebriforme]
MIFFNRGGDEKKNLLFVLTIYNLPYFEYHILFILMDNQTKIITEFSNFLKIIIRQWKFQHSVFFFCLCVRCCCCCSWNFTMLLYENIKGNYVPKFPSFTWNG